MARSSLDARGLGARLASVGRREALALAVPLALYVACAAVLGDWIVDDAGTSFAYARSAAGGHGFVSQPGRPPVEGFSNFLWVVLLVPTFWARLFHPIVTPKILGALGVAGALALFQRTLRRATEGEAAGVAAALLVAVSTPVVVWTTSGLENALTLVLGAALYDRLVARPPRWTWHAGAIAALLAMAHPEGAIYLAAPLAVAALDLARRRDRPIRLRLAALLEPVLAFTAIFGPFMAFRLAVFHLPFPQPYYAKRTYSSLGERLASLAHAPAATFHKLVDLCEGVAGPAGAWILLAAALGVAVLAARRRLRPHAGVAALLAAIAMAAYVAVDDDWMREYRFGTLAAAFSIVAAVAAFAEIAGGAKPAFRRPVALAGAALAVSVAWQGVPRLARFAENPTVPYRDVERIARRMDAYADLLGLREGSVLLPDVGATLVDSRLTVYDLAGLCDPDVIRTIKAGTPVWRFHHPEFFDWLFGTLKPTFISTHDFWTLVAALEDDPRFAREYVAVNAYDDRYVAATYGRRLHAGDFVRRDALASPADLERLRAYQPPPRPDPFVDRVEAALGLGPPGTPEGLRKAADQALAQADPKRAASLYARALAESPGDLEVSSDLALALDAGARPAEARAVWADVLALAKARGDHAREDAALARLDMGAVDAALMEQGLVALRVQNEPARAVTIFQQILAHTPSHYGARYQLAKALDAAGRGGEATLVWSQVLQAAESIGDTNTVAEVRTRLGQVWADTPEGLMATALAKLYQDHDAPAAIVILQKVIERSPSHYGAHYQLAVALDQAKRPAEAKAMWAKVLTMAQANHDAPAEAKAKARLAKNP
jgi:tetratricopeptide (TPR) repeat protein